MVAVLSFLRFIYAVYHDRVPRHYYGLVIIGALLGIWGWFNPNLGWWNPVGGRTYTYFFALLVHVEMLRAVLVPVLVERRGPYVVSLGVLAFILAFSYPLLVVTGFLYPYVDLQLFPNFVILGLLLAISLYLSRRFAQTNVTLEKKLEEVTHLSAQQLEHERQIRQQEVERKLLEAEYQQKLKELEEARDLQLSMLPRSMPDHPNLDLAAYMQTATEVGGDYYDFHIEDDGTLTVAVGDATGHGMKAGTMVTATKSLFNALGRETNLLHIFDRSTRALKEMNLRQLYMALSLEKFEEGQLRLATAGMPPTLIFRAATGRVEAVRLKGMPLGSFVNFPYQEETLDLAPGDTVLFMSDGFPELFNDQQEMLGYDRAVEVFESVADKAPQAIIAHLVELGRTWTNNRPPNDDMTFVAIKMRGGER